MSTLFVKVDKANQAVMLAEWLKNITFVKDVNIQEDIPQKGNVKKVQAALDAIPAEGILSSITDPLEYERMIRDEW